MRSEDQYFAEDIEIATVISAENGWLTVELESRDACHSCGAKMLCRPNDSGKRILKIRATQATLPGDRVVIEQIGGNQLKIALVQYGLPLMTFLGTIIIASRVITEPWKSLPAEVVQFICGIGAVILTGVCIYWWSRRQVKRGFFVFRLRAVLKTR